MRFVNSDGSVASAVTVQSKGVQTGENKQGREMTIRSTEQHTATATTKVFQESEKVNKAVESSRPEQWSEDEYFRRRVQDAATPKVANKATAFSQTVEESEGDHLAQKGQAQEGRPNLQTFHGEGKESFTSRSISSISEINTNDDVSDPSWTELSEVDSKDGSLKHFPPSDDISDLSQTSASEPLTSVRWVESEDEISYSISAQPPRHNWKRWHRWSPLGS